MDIARYRPPEGRTALAVIDAQERLAAAMPADDYARFLRATLDLLAMARELAMPVLVTEQYPKGLGPTVPEIRDALGDAAPAAEKLTFSAFGCEPFAAAVRERGLVGLIVTGMEAHVCVVETALDALAADLKVFVPHDGVCSRDPRDRAAGLELLRSAGAAVTSSETLLFQALGRAGTPAFKTLSARLRKR